MAQSNKDGLVEYTSQLILRPVKDEHAGFYQCIVSNALGTSYSAKAEITVGGKNVQQLLNLLTSVTIFSLNKFSIDTIVILTSSSFEILLFPISLLLGFLCVCSFCELLSVGHYC